MSGALTDAGTPTVRDLLALEVLAGARVIGGADGLDAHARSVAVVGRVARPQVGDGAVVLLVPPPGASGLDADVALRHCAELGVAGLLLPAALAGLSTARVADRLGVPAVAVGDGDPWALARRLDAAVRSPLLERADLALAAARAVRRAGADPRDAVAALTVALRTAVAIVDGAGGAVAGGPPGALPEGLLAPSPRTLPDRDGLLVAAPIAVVREPDAWLVAGPVAAGPERAVAIAAGLEIAAAALAGTFARRRLAVERDARLQAGLLADLLALTGPAPAALAERAVAAGWRSSGWHIGLHVVAVAGTLDTVALRTRLAEAEIDAVVVGSGGGWSAWVTGDAEPGTGAYRALVRDARALAHAVAPEVTLHIGIGAPHAGLRGIGRTVAEARDACELAAGTPGAGPAVEPVGEQDARRLLLGSSASPAFRGHAKALLAPLQDEPDLLATLEAYLEHESSTAGAAAALGVHRNTVLHRVRRAEALLGVSLARADERLVLQLACRSLRGAG